MWQKCPICNGSGIDPSPQGVYAGTRCRACKGSGLINELTGLPPYEVDTKTSTSIEINQGWDKVDTDILKATLNR